MNAEPVNYYNRYTDRIETETIYCEAFLRWSYETVLGRLTLNTLTKRTAFSRWHGWRMSRSASRKYIFPFIHKYGLKPAEFEDPPESFKSFNEFFCRRLKQSARPVSVDPALAVFPSDGRHLGFQDISHLPAILVKGQELDLPALLRDDDLVRRYHRGTMVLSRLSPIDCHRFAFPISGTPSEAVLINGALNSVNPVALRRNLRIFSENKRWISQLHSPHFGPVTMVEVAATGVGTVQYTYAPGSHVLKGNEKGFFKIGGSSIITFFQPGRIRLSSDLVENTYAGREIYAHLGDNLGRLDG